MPEHQKSTPPPKPTSTRKPPWEPDDPVEFSKGWFSLDLDDDGFRTRLGKRQAGF